MSVTPTGSPAWVRNADHTSYGGHVDKINYQNQPVVNPLTDVGAEDIARIAADLAAVVRTAPFTVLTYTCSDSAPAAPTVHAAHHMPTGVRVTDYVGDAAPTGFPSAARNGNGDVTFTWASTYNDPYGVAGAVSISDATANGHGSGARIVNPDVVTALTVRVRAFDAAGVAATNTKVTLKVWT